MVAVVFLAWSLATWFGAGRFAAERTARQVEHVRLETQTRARAISANIVLRLSQVRNFPILMADEPSLAAVLRRFGPDAQPSSRSRAQRQAIWQADPELADLAHRLRRMAANLGLESMYVLNAAGDCVAAGHSPDTPDFTGANYADRTYFIAARNGNHGRQFAVGRVSNAPALYYCSPVIPAGSRFLGAVVARTDLASLCGQVSDRDTFVTDENGVIIQSRDPELLLRTLPDSSIDQVPAAERMQRYKRTQFQPIDLTPYPGGLLCWKHQPWPCVLATHTSPDGILAVHVLGDMKEVVAFQRERLWLFAWASLTGLLTVALVAGGIHFVSSSRRHQTELAYQAQTDELTRCANRRHFLDALKAEQLRWTRYGATFSLLSLDLDHFKSVNDRHGHPGGDEVLRHFVRTVTTILRPTDLLGRMGGEEFAVLLPHTTADRAERTAERIRAAVEAAPASYQGASVAVTVSIGLAQWVSQEDSLDDLLNRSDQALYQAKELGRNRVARSG
jgi:diguanylate cyclase (GGDEF)-like protein